MHVLHFKIFILIVNNSIIIIIIIYIFDSPLISVSVFDTFTSNLNNLSLVYLSGTYFYFGFSLINFALNFIIYTFVSKPLYTYTVI